MVPINFFRMALKIVNPDVKFKKVSLVDPSMSQYLHIAARVDNSWGPFFFGCSAKKKNILHLAKIWCDKLRVEGIKACVFKAAIIPPGKGRFLKEHPEIEVARYDVAVLIEADSVDKIEQIENTEGYTSFLKQLRDVSQNTHVIKATNVKRIASVDHSKQGVFLFNYFFAEDLGQNLEVWEYTAGWFQQETGLSNSTVLLPNPATPSEYTIINHCRWDGFLDVLPSLIFKKSFRSYVLDNFYANRVAAMPVLYSIV